MRIVRSVNWETWEFGVGYSWERHVDAEVYLMLGPFSVGLRWYWA